MLSNAGLLGFFFPGSPMWETRRHLRAQGFYSKGNGFNASFRNLGWGMVSATSMDMYLGPDGVDRDKFDETKRQEMSMHENYLPPLSEDVDAPKAADDAVPDNTFENPVSTFENPVSSFDNLSPRTTAFEQEDGGRSPSPSRMPSFDAKKLSPRAAYKLKMQEREEADGQTIGNVAPGIPAWRKLISRPLAKYVNYDGQFM